MHEIAKKLDVLCEARRFADARACVEEFAATSREPLFVHVLLGNIALDEGKHDEKAYLEALSEFDQALALAPKHDVVWTCKGTALSGLRRYHEACQAYQEAVSLNPRNLKAQQRLVEVLRYLFRADEALQVTQQALIVFPNDATLWLDQSAISINRKDFERALESAERALESNLDDTAAHWRAWYFKATALHNLHRYELALAAYERAEAFNPAEHWTLLGKSKALLRLRRYRKALLTFWKSTQTPPPYKL